MRKFFLVSLGSAVVALGLAGCGGSLGCFLALLDFLAPLDFRLQRN
jgi:hypothetical protein